MLVLSQAYSVDNEIILVGREENSEDRARPFMFSSKNVKLASVCLNSISVKLLQETITNSNQTDNSLVLIAFGGSRSCQAQGQVASQSAFPVVLSYTQQFTGRFPPVWKVEMS